MAKCRLEAAAVATMCLLLAPGPGAALNLRELVEGDPELKEFGDVIRQSSYVLSLLAERSGTLFAATNEAMRSYQGPRNKNLLFYHLSNVPLTTDELGISVSTDYPGNKLLWVTVVEGEGGVKSFYVNDAKIVRRDIRGSTADGELQVLHVIDRVLELVLPMSNVQTDLLNPLASKLLQSSIAYHLQASVTNFDQSLRDLAKYPSFERTQESTFFIPVDDPEAPAIRLDDRIVDSHVIPGKVLFVRSANASLFPTLTFGKDIKVVGGIYRVFDTDRGVYTDYAMSRTILGDAFHPEGIVVSRIVLANIPVRNGVVHLIERPLMVVQDTVTQLLKQESKGQFRRFFETIQDYSQPFLQELESLTEATLFVPSNDAFDGVGKSRLDNLLADRRKLRSLLRIHLVPDARIMFADVLDGSRREATTAEGTQKLLLSFAVDESGRQRLTVEGRGSNATVLVPDVLAANGVIHIVDRIMGIPYQSVREKLAGDPVLSDSFHLGERSGFNQQLDDDGSGTRKFTFFVPENRAWRDAKRQGGRQDNAESLLLTDRNPHLVQEILSRHLVVGEQLSGEDLRNVSLRNGTLLPVEGRSISLRSMGSGDLLVERDGVRARIVRSDVECTNGVIHVVDKVFVGDGDFFFAWSGAAAARASCAAAAGLVFLSSRYARKLTSS